ncbi:MAG: hypothetical protein AB7N65_29675, partial [Vicinamibacterales bacterium]
MTAHTRSLARTVLSVLPMLAVSAVWASAQEWSSARPDGHAPLGVMGDHTQEKGEVILSYRFMPMRMAGNREGTESQSPSNDQTRFPVTPQRMPKSKQMFCIMFAPT